MGFLGQDGVYKEPMGHLRKWQARETISMHGRTDGRKKSPGLVELRGKKRKGRKTRKEEVKSPGKGLAMQA